VADCEARPRRQPNKTAPDDQSGAVRLAIIREATHTAFAMPQDFTGCAFLIGRSLVGKAASAAVTRHPTAHSGASGPRRLQPHLLL
jgi:hypothetical protein